MPRGIAQRESRCLACVRPKIQSPADQRWIEYSISVQFVLSFCTNKTVGLSPPTSVAQLSLYRVWEPMLDPGPQRDLDPGGIIVLSTICKCPTGPEDSKPLDSCSRHHVACPKYSPIIDPRQLFRCSPTCDCLDSKVTHKESWIKGQKHLQSQIENSINFLGMSLLHSLPLASSGNPQVLTPSSRT